MMQNLNWPTVPKLFTAIGQVGASWIAEDNVRWFDAFTDIGASPFSNELMNTWRHEGWAAGVPLRTPHIIGNPLRDEQYPRMLGDHLQLDDPRIFYTSGGSDAVEAAMKLARKATGRETIIGIDGDFHGRSFANLSIQNAPAHHRAGFYTEQVPRMGWVSTDAQTLPRDVAAMVISPINGNNTLELWPDNVWTLAHQVQAQGGLIIFDEVQTGFGRAGGVVSICNSWDWRPPLRPDIWCFGKAAGAGWPHAPVIARGELADEMGLGTHFNTMAGSPMGCYLSTKLIEWLTAAGIERMRAQRTELVERFKSIFAYGYMMAIETDDPYALCQRAHAVQLLLHTARADKPVRLAPPFLLTLAEMETLIFKLSLAGVH